MKIKKTITDLIGNTPLVSLDGISKDLGSEIFAKLEYFNPGGSIKDRIGYSMISDAEKRNIIKPGRTTIVEPTSGNTGIGLAITCIAKGYDLILVMPENMSIERRKYLSALGVKIILTPEDKGMAGSLDAANHMSSELKDSYIPNQFENRANPDIHERTTGVEIWDDTGGSIDILVCGVGTGGTITGCGRLLKSRKKSIEIVAVEPYGSPVLSGGKPGRHQIQGIGAGFIPGVLDMSIIDRIIKVRDSDAIETSQRLAAEEGIMAGISSGAAVFGAIHEAKNRVNEGKTIVTVLPDTGERYLSTHLFKDNSSTY